MSTEKTHLKNAVLAGASNTKSDGLIISTGSAKQNIFFLVAGSLLASFACIIAYVSKSGGQYLVSSVNGMNESTGALSHGIYEATSGSLEHATDVLDIFGMIVSTANEETTDDNDPIFVINPPFQPKCSCPDGPPSRECCYVRVWCSRRDPWCWFQPSGTLCRGAPGSCHPVDGCICL